jgi:hypothetical protein
VAAFVCKVSGTLSIFPIAFTLLSILAFMLSLWGSGAEGVIGFIHGTEFADHQAIAKALKVQFPRTGKISSVFLLFFLCAKKFSLCALVKFVHFA